MTTAPAPLTDAAVSELVETRFFHEGPLLMCVAQRGRFLSLGGAWERTLGWTLTELLEAPALAYVHPDDVAATGVEIERLRRGEPTIRFVNRYRRKAGGWVTLQWDALASGDDGDTVFAIAQDITVIRERDEALARRTAVLEAITEAQRAFIEVGLSPAMLQAMLKRLLRLTDSALGFVATVQGVGTASPALAVRGCASSDPSLPPLSPVLRELDAPYGRAVTSGRPVRLSFPEVAPREMELPLVAHTVLALPLDGGPGGPAMGALVLVNRRGGYEASWEGLLEPLVRALSAMFLLQERRAHAAALESEVQRLSDVSTVVFEGADLSVITTDTVGAIRYMNPVAVRMLGAAALEHSTNLATFHDAAELAEAAARVHEAPRTLTPFEQLVGPAHAAGGTDRREWTYVSMSGVRYAVQVTMRAVRDRLGGLAGWVAIGTELTAARQAAHDRGRVVTLEGELALLRRQVQEAARISEAATYVGASRTVREALDVIGALLPPTLTGAAPQLLVTRAAERPSSGPAEARPPGAASIDLQACWAATTGQTFVSAAGGVRCAHLAGVSDDWVCAPLGDATRVVGVLSAPLPATGGARDAALSALRDEARQLSAVLANLQLRHQLEEQALRDPLTGAVNRRHLERELTAALRRLARGGPSLALLMVDVDHFKQVNDTHGHDAGDAVLKDLVALLRAKLRATDLLARVGGEEFMIVLYDLDRAAAEKVAEALREAVAATPLAGGALRCTCSFGGALVTAAEADRPLAAHWRRADGALYEAKQQGRNRVRFAAASSGGGEAA
jgi:diguanylate cyclase (GGDEF)-like protein/PAS domain S-box-containing protein